jgi:serine/threonine protein kinase
MDDDGSPMGLCDADVAHTSEIVGRGGSGVVRRGTIQLGGGAAPLAVAIKTLHAGATESDQRKFVKEIGASLRASERCPRACRMYGCVRHEGALCLVMKLYSRSLHDLLDARRSPDGSNLVQPLGYEEVVALAMQILEGLAQLHAEGIVVQDLKPGNILVDEHGELVISDFGLAAVLNATVTTAQSSTAAGGGTPAYKAPEQYDEDSFGKVSPQTDIWAFGCVLIELITGAAPWRGKQPMQIMMSVAGKRHSPAVPERASPMMAGLLRACLSHTQASRPTAQQALDQLRPLALPEGVPHLSPELLAEVDRRVAHATARFQLENARFHQEIARFEQEIARMHGRIAQLEAAQAAGPAGRQSGGSTRKEVMDFLNGNRNLSGQDIRELDLSSIDFRGASLFRRRLMAQCSIIRSLAGVTPILSTRPSAERSCRAQTSRMRWR